MCDSYGKTALNLDDLNARKSKKGMEKKPTSIWTIIINISLSDFNETILCEQIYRRLENARSSNTEYHKANVNTITKTESLEVLLLLTKPI